MALNRIDEILTDLRQGRMVIIMDDEDRENEGDLLMAASLVRPEDINFMARYGRGLICLTLTRERCQQLHLPLMVQDNATPYSTNFTVSVEAAQGVTTGISAYDRAHTIRTAVRPDARPEDLVQPGHIFPLMAQAGGVLTRAGHTEAGCDLTRLAGLEPAAVIVEILNEDGNMARRPDLEIFAEQHGVKIGTIAELIHYRMQNEKTVERVADALMHTEFGPFRVLTYQDVIGRQVHFALVKGEIHASEPVMVRVHVQHLLSDLLALRLPDSGWPLRDALQARRQRTVRGPGLSEPPRGTGGADPAHAQLSIWGQRTGAGRRLVCRITHLRHRRPDSARHRRAADAGTRRAPALIRPVRLQSGSG